MHVLSAEGGVHGAIEWETDRARFLGRGRTPEDPIALDGRALSGTTGAVLDPVLSLRRRVRIAPGGQVRLAFATGVATSRAAAIALAEKYDDPASAARTFALAATQTQMRLRHLGISTDEAQLYEQLASHVLWTDASLRAAPEFLAGNTLGQPGLWSHGISGDLPILHATLQPPSGAHWLGTDALGRDYLTQLIYGSRVSLLVGIVAVSLAGAVGMTLGLIAGYFGSWIGNIIMRVIDALLALPPMVLMLAIAAMLGGGLRTVLISIGVAMMPTYCRLMNGQVISLKTE